MYYPKVVAVCAAIGVLLGIEHILHKRRIKLKTQRRRNKERQSRCRNRATNDLNEPCNCDIPQQTSSITQPRDIDSGSIPGGLVNLRTMCFFNATIQAIASSTHFLQSLHPISGSRPLAQVLHKLCAAINERRSKNHVHVSTHVANAIHTDAHMIQGRQQDAHELFLVLLDRLDAERNVSSAPDGASAKGLSIALDQRLGPMANQGMRGDASQSHEEGREISNLCEKTKLLRGVYPKEQARAGVYLSDRRRQTPVMMGLSASHLVCERCGGRFPIKVDPFMDLSLPLPADRASTTLVESISTYLEPQLITDYWCWRCSALQALRTTATTLSVSEKAILQRCTRSAIAFEDPEAMKIIETLPRVKSNVHRYIRIARTPRVLSLHISRLQYHAALGRMYKSRCRLLFDSSLMIPSPKNSRIHSQPIPVGEPGPSFAHIFPSTHKSTYAKTHGTLRCGNLASQSAAESTGDSQKNTSREPTEEYELVAVMVHQGGDLGGHFYTYRKIPAKTPATDMYTESHTNAQHTPRKQLESAVDMKRRMTHVTADSKYTSKPIERHEPNNFANEERLKAGGEENILSTRTGPGSAPSDQQRSNSHADKDDAFKKLSIEQQTEDAHTQRAPDENTHRLTELQRPVAEGLATSINSRETDTTSIGKASSDEWYMISDEFVKLVDFSTVQADSAYMLLYERIDSG